uniref:Uncharacterized protein n=1 Tax=Romanomermis culicivorax TaxID=13658 RepID=A0A915IWT0_ROMCU
MKARVSTQNSSPAASTMAASSSKKDVPLGINTGRKQSLWAKKVVSFHHGDRTLAVPAPNIGNDTNLENGSNGHHSIHHQSMTRQLAFEQNLQVKKKKNGNFYNDSYANTLAKICTVVVFVVTGILALMAISRSGFYAKNGNSQGQITEDRAKFSYLQR